MRSEWLNDQRLIVPEDVPVIRMKWGSFVDDEGEEGSLRISKSLTRVPRADVPI